MSCKCARFAVTPPMFDAVKCMSMDQAGEFFVDLLACVYGNIDTIDVSNKSQQYIDAVDIFMSQKGIMRYKCMCDDNCDATIIQWSDKVKNVSVYNHLVRRVLLVPVKSKAYKRSSVAKAQKHDAQKKAMRARKTTDLSNISWD